MVPAEKGETLMNTPGYNIRLTITIKADKNGRTRATYWSMAAGRNLPIAMADAQEFLATGQADRAPVKEG